MAKNQYRRLPSIDHNDIANLVALTSAYIRPKVVIKATGNTTLPIQKGRKKNLDELDAEGGMRIFCH